MVENNPPFQLKRWVDEREAIPVPEGRKNGRSEGLLSPLTGLGVFLMPGSSDTSLGYFPLSLWDWDSISRFKS